MRPRETKFVILSSQRSGSTWFADVLNGHPDTNAYGELFLPPRTDRPAADQSAASPDTEAYVKDLLHGFPRFLADTPKEARIPVWGVFGYLNRLYRQSGAVGFKLMYTQLFAYPSIWAYIAARRLRVVHLVRRNHLDVVISSVMSKATKTTRRIAGEPEMPSKQIELEPVGLLRSLRKLKRNIRIARVLLRMFLIPHLEVSYEDLAGDAASFRAVWKFLSIDEEKYEPRSDLVKLVKGDHAEVISNYCEVKESLAATEFAEMVR